MIKRYLKETKKSCAKNKARAKATPKATPRMYILAREDEQAKADKKVKVLYMSVSAFLQREGAPKTPSLCPGYPAEGG